MIWYPYEQMKTMKAPYKIIKAKGVHLYTEDQKLIDSVSSWWCMIHGYQHPELTAAIQEQAANFCHVMLGGLTHDPVEKLSAKLEGFLPGDLQSKVDPYLRPLYDALYQIMGSDSFLKNMEKGLIEVAPLAYMRGRTLDNAFIILDEAQNTSPAQMKMFLTRIGFGSKVVITGDQTQKDLPSGAPSGLDTAMKVLGKVEDISFCQLTSKDVVRHPLVQKIVTAYEEYEKKEAYKESRQAARKKSTDKKAWENR